ncbi:hypothetical protein QBC44DRAFT_325841 [Cladorrhinum sp. PSN332]|nr:hypothetical protein QBC44DRAFT_325841 [Cladorrhinum sp. PSN332]
MFYLFTFYLSLFFSSLFPLFTYFTLAKLTTPPPPGESQKTSKPIFLHERKAKAKAKPTQTTNDVDDDDDDVE